MKRFIILMLRDLKLRQFDTEEDWRAAISTLTTSQIQFVPLRWHAGADQYVMVGINE